MNVKHIALAAVAALALTACDVTPKARPAAEAPVLAPATRPSTLRAGDKIDLKFFYAPELNDSQTVSPDGQITLQLIGDVQAAGRTPNELAEVLKTAYSNQLKYPNVTVILRESYQRKVYVAGEVQKPGLLDMPADMSVLQAVLASGGFNTTTAQTKQVLIIRQVGDKRVGYELNVEDALLGGEHASFMLQAQDIVYVPRTTITNVNNFVDQYISKIIPQTGFILFNAN
ncbi:MAG TPA: polysaccharide biosynthesis/export family protein [Tepidisphaeraceae bacterium]|jgi:protein involved in polysaccharide export with SLBB domain